MQICAYKEKSKLLHNKIICVCIFNKVDPKILF